MEPSILGTISRSSFNNAIGEQNAKQLEDFTRLRAVIQDSKNEKNYKVAHQSDQEKLMLKGLETFRRLLRYKLGNINAKKAKKIAHARYRWRLIKDLSMSLILRNISSLQNLTSRHYGLLGRRIKSSIKRHSIGDILYNKGDESLGVYILMIYYIIKVMNH